MKNKFLSRIGQWHTPPYLRKLKTDIVHCASCIVHRASLALLLVMLMSVNVWGEKITTVAGITSGNKYYVGATTGDKDSYFYVDGSAKTESIKGVAKEDVADAVALTFTAVTDGWTIQFDNGLYLGIKNAKDNGAVQVMEEAVVWTIDEDTDNGLLELHPNDYYLQKNNSATQFGSYKNTQTNVWLEEVSTTSKTLVSVAVSGSPTKTTYEAGESFDHAGLVVTGTYDDESEEAITSNITWNVTPNPLTAGTTSVSVTATVGEITSAAYVVNGLTITEHVVTPGTYEIVPNNTFFGVEVQTSGKHDPVTGKQNDITITHSGGSSFYCNASQVRTYKDNTLTFSVPEGYEITSIVLAVTDNASYNADNGTYTASSKTWAGHAQQVVLTSAQSSGNYQITKITVTFAAPKVVSGIAVKNAPTKTTYYVGDEFDPAGLVITASYDDESDEDIAYTEDNKDAFSFSGFNSEAEATDQVITVTYAEKSATFNVDIQAARVLNSIEVASNPAKMVYEVGEALDLTGLVVNGIFSKGDPEPVDYTADPADGTTLDAVGNATVTLTSVDNTELTTSFDVTVTAPVGDKLTPALVGNKSSYAQWDNAYVGTYATYIGYGTGGDAKFQLKSKDNVAGIVSTVSGGYIAKVKVDWETVPGDGKGLKVFGSHTAYTAASDLYGDNKGTEIGSILASATELTITDEYEYVGVRSVDGAVYLNSITFVWAAPKVLEGIAVKTAPTAVEYAAGEFFNPAGLEITASYDDESTADIAYEGNEDKFSFSPALDVALATTDEQVTITYGGKSCDQTITVKNIGLTSIVVSGDLAVTDYTEGDDFDFTGLVATGYYSDESHKTITEQVVWSIDPATLTAGQTSVKVIATMNEVSGDEIYYITVAAAPSIVTWDLTKDETATATADEISWTSDFATMIDVKGESTTPANNYYPGDKDSHTSTRFYKNSVLTIAPVDNNVIVKVEFTATSEGYASALQGSTWTNASASVSNTTLVTVTPTDGTQAFSATIGGTCGFTAVKVYYQPGATMTSIAVKTAPSKVVYNAGESFDPTGLEITATYDDASTKDITYDANDTKWEFAPGLTDKLDATDNEVFISYNEIMCEDALEITVNRIASNLAAVSATKILVVDDAPSLADWYTIDANYDGTVAFQSDNDEVFYVEGAKGLALAAGSATLTITAPQTGTYAQASVTVAVTVNAAAVPCSVKWMNNGEEYTVGGPSTVVNAGQKVTKLPTAPEPCDAQHNFMGWTNAAIATPQADAPSILFTDAVSAPTVDADNTIYYAVYAIKSIDEDIDSYTFTGVGTVTGGVATLTTSSGNTIKMDKGEGSNPPAWNAGASEARLYANGLMTVSSSETISKIVYSYTVNANSKGASPTIDGVAGATTAGTWDSENKTWTGSDTEVTFSTSGSAGNIGFTNVTIYTGGGYKYSDYSTTCAAIELDAIELGGTYPTTFLVGDEFSHEGMTVTASYTNSTTTKDVTNLVTFTDKATGEAVDMSAAGDKTILVSYTENEITKTAEYNITINDLPTMTIAQFLANPSKCYLSGIVSNITNTTYGNYTLTDASGNAEIYGTLTPSKESKQFATLGIAEGDKIKVIAENYSTQYENISDVIFVEELELTAIVVSGTMNVTEYTEGNTLSSEGLVVKGKYSDETEAMHDITEGITWNMPTAVLGTSEYDVTATVGTLTSPAYHVTGITVNAAKVLTGIAITTEPKKTFWVGENFSTTGIQVMASYDGDEDADVTTLCTFSRAETQITDAIVNETITVSYTEGTETKTATYTINANWMTLADLVENVTPTETAVKVWVKITDALVKARNNSYLTTDVTYGDSQTKEVKIYKSGVDATWVAGGTISGELKDVDWKLYGSDWELMPSDWTWATYTPAAPTPVIGVSLNESAIKVKVGKTATLVATVTPDNATDKSVTWSIINDNANGKVTVDQTGLVTVAADAVEGATATVQVKTNEGNFTATCNVTVDVPVVTKYYLVTDASTLHVGDIIVFGSTYTGGTDEAKKGSFVNGTLGNNKYLASERATITEDALSATDACEFVLGGEAGAWTLTSTEGQLGATAVKAMTTNTEASNYVGTWTISIDVETHNATVTCGEYGSMSYNGSSPRFANYSSVQNALQLYRKYETIRTGMVDGQIGTGCQTKNILDVKGATLYQVNYTYGSYLEFMEVTYPVEAGMPIIMQADGTNGGKVEILYGNDVATDGIIYNNNGLYGFIGAGIHNIPNYEGYYVFKGGMLRPALDNYTTSGHAYIKLSEVPTEDQLAGSPAPRRRMSVGVERSMPTGFETIMMQKGMNKVIMNNQLFLIRDGKLFNAQGALVK
ncbi:MAG: bacterial Ig-like domain-containing protein [Paludibacteraceae bacterium]|nr:bacterial Ig-like domain-containing protein [Paludibacteraceae bacterium]